MPVIEIARLRFEGRRAIFVCPDQTNRKFKGLVRNIKYRVMKNTNDTLENQPGKV
ncbi:hypothetical protein GCM10008931_37670 [Oceanobacillus oncorhynchi subsp. oncorhynchi]